MPGSPNETLEHTQDSSFGRGGGSPRYESITPDPSYQKTTSKEPEDYEIRFYDVRYEVSDTLHYCNQIANVKSKEVVHFQNANTHDHGCNFTFKVDKGEERDIIQLLQKLDPEDMNENIRTIASHLEHAESEIDILKQKRQSIEDTLSQTKESYDELQQMAKEEGDTESLANIIEGKLKLINDLTSQKINIIERIQRIERDMQNQLDRLKFTYFSVRVIEDKIFNWEQIKQSWENSTKTLVNTFNETIKKLTIDLVKNVLIGVQVFFYGLLSVIVLKIFYVLALRIVTWKK